MDANRRAELARISGALIRAMGHAQALAARGDFGGDLLDLLQHARELHDLALEVLAPEHDPPAESRELAAALGDKLAELEAELAMQRPPKPLH